MEEMTGNPRVYSSPSLVRKARLEYTTCDQWQATAVPLVHCHPLGQLDSLRKEMRSAERGGKSAVFFMPQCR